MRSAGRQVGEKEMLFLWGYLHHRSAPSQPLERAAPSPYRLADLIKACVGSPPFRPLDPLTTRKEASRPERAGLKGLPRRRNAIAPMTRMLPLHRPRLSPARSVTQRDVSISHLRALGSIQEATGFAPETSLATVRVGCAPCNGGAFQRVQAPPGNRSSRKQSEQRREGGGWV